MFVLTHVQYSFLNSQLSIHAQYLINVGLRNYFQSIVDFFLQQTFLSVPPMVLFYSNLGFDRHTTVLLKVSGHFRITLEYVLKQDRNIACIME